MARHQLIGDIRVLDGLLRAQQHQLRRTGQQRIARLRRLSPLWLVGGGVVAGLLAGRLANISTVGRAGLYSWLLGGIRLWRLSSLLAAQPADSASGAAAPP